LIPVAVLSFVYYAYQVVKAWRTLKNKPKLSKKQLFSRFNLAIAVIFACYFGLSILWELDGKGQDGFSMLLPVFLFCVALCGVALYRELGDLPDDFEGDS
jgi:hypothetical protein